MTSTGRLTSQQRKATHKYFEEVARELNNQGIDVKVLVSNLRVDATPEMVKNIYRAIGKEKFGITSTEELTTTQVTQCYEEMNRLLASVGCHVAFPSQENTDEYLRSFVQ